MLIVKDREALARRKSSKLAWAQQNQARSESFRINFWQQQALLEETLARGGSTFRGPAISRTGGALGSPGNCDGRLKPEKKKRLGK